MLRLLHSPLTIVVILAAAAAIAWRCHRSRQSLPPSVARLPGPAFGAHVAFGLVLPLWPIAAFMNIFLFDSPSKSPTWETVRQELFWVVVFYPAFYLAGLVLSRKALSRWSRRTCILLAFLPLLPLAAQGALLLPMILKSSEVRASAFPNNR